MHILLIGSNGFIGRALLARLNSEGHSVSAVVRSKGAAAGLSAKRFIYLSVARSVRSEDWLPHLKNVDAVVNCAGLLQGGPGQSLRDVHVDGIAALFEACERRGVQRVIHFSAIGVDREQPSSFSATKFEGDRSLMATTLDWIILRPSVVIGRAAYGGSALFRGLAALPLLPVMPNSGPLQIVQLQDVIDTVLFFLRSEAPSRLAVDLAGPQGLSFVDVVLAFRNWLGWSKPYYFRVPDWTASVTYKLGDFLGFLGWRPPIRSTARQEIARGAVGDNRPWINLTGIHPTSLEDALAAEPASVQERWFSQLYFLKPLAFSVFALFWIATGLISLGPGWDIGKQMLFEGGVRDPIASLAIIAGAVSDIVIGVGIAWRKTTRPALYAGVGISIAYAVIGTILVPRLWADPLGPMLKIWPVIALNLILIAILRDR
jgi:uncharacterized protein YbjT (DUF2867 family)